MAFGIHDNHNIHFITTYRFGFYYFMFVVTVCVVFHLFELSTQSVCVCVNVYEFTHNKVTTKSRLQNRYFYITNEGHKVYN